MNIMQYVLNTCCTATHRWQKYSVLSQTPVIVDVIVVISTKGLYENQDEFDYGIFQNANSFSSATID